ncbi:MAG: EAL domain-containing protein [Bacillota bacterium]
MKTIFKSFLSRIKSFLNNYGLIILIIVPIMLLANWGMIFLKETEKENIKLRQNDLVEQQLNTIDFIISTGITNTHNDLHVIRDAEETTNYIENQNDTNLEALEQLIYRIATNKPEFLNIRLVNPSGDEIIKVIRNNDSPTIIDSDDLENISNNQQHYIANNLEKNELYLSPLFLNNNSIPTISFILKIFDNTDNYLYYLKINYNANSLLAIFSEYQNSNIDFINFGLINNDLLWKIEPQENGTDIFIHSDIPENLLSNDDDSVYKYNLVLSDMIDHNVYNQDDFFVLYADIDFQGAYNKYGSYLLKYPAIIYIINLFIFSLTLTLALIIKNKNENRLLLNANMYLSDKNKDGVLITNNEFKITYINEAFTNIYGYHIDDIKGKTPHNVFNIHQFEINPDNISPNNIFKKNIWNNSKNGVFILKYLRIRPETTAGGKTKHYVEIYSKPILKTNLIFDNNLTSTSEELKLMVDAFKHLDFNQKKSCFVIIKLFNEKNRKNITLKTRDKYNDYIFAKYLRLELEKQYHIASPGFGLTIIYSENKVNKDCIEKLETLIDKYKRKPIINPQLEYHFGISSENIVVKSKYELYYQALLALEMAIKQKNTKHLVYDNTIKSKLDREKAIYNQLNYAFENSEFSLKYQIQYNLKNDKYFGAEALLRWNNKELGKIYPNEFIPIIENSFYVNQLSLLVVKLVIKDIEPYIDNLKEDFRIFINLTAFDFLNEYIIQNIIKVIETSKIKTKHFFFEITESGYLTNKDRANELIDYLKSKDIRVAIDDFGTGFSAIGILKDINVDMVKVDRSFILKYPELDDGTMFKSLTNIVNNLGLDLLAEGIETKEQLEFAKLNHCKYLQGYYFSKPLSINEFAKKFLK